MRQVDPLQAYDWLLFLSLVVAATTILWFRDWLKASGDRQRQRALTRRALAFLFWGSLPWAVMAAGILSGAMKSSKDFFNPANGVFSFVWIASIVAVWVALLYWLFAKGGAEELASSGHMALGGLPTKEPAHVKLVFVLAVVGGVIGLAYVIAANLP